MDAKICQVTDLKNTAGKILGVDFGDTRTGLAVSDISRFLASGIGYVSPGGIEKTAQAVADTVREKKAVAVVVYGNRAYEDTLVELEDTLKESGFQVIGGAAVVAEHSIFREFAKGRPDTDDEVQLKAWSEQLKAKAEVGGTVSFFGNRPYKPYGAIPMKPKAQTCQNCGKCVAVCPVGAIPQDDPKETDAEKCISCMACVSVCPIGAREVAPAILEGAKKRLQSALEGRKENEIFL